MHTKWPFQNLQEVGSNIAPGTFLYSFIKKVHEKEEKEFESNRELNAKVTS